MSPRKHITPDIVEIQAKENVIVLGTKANTIVVKQRGVEKRQCETLKENNDPVYQNGETCDHNQSDQMLEDTVCQNGDIEMVAKEVVGEDAGNCGMDGGVADDEFEDEEDGVSDSEGEESDASSAHSSHGSPAPR